MDTLSQPSPGEPRLPVSLPPATSWNNRFHSCISMCAVFPQANISICMRVTDLTFFFPPPKPALKRSPASLLVSTAQVALRQLVIPAGSFQAHPPGIWQGTVSPKQAKEGLPASAVTTVTTVYRAGAACRALWGEMLHT